MYIVVLLIYLLVLYNIYLFISPASVLKISFWIFVAYTFLLITHLFSGISYNVGNIARIIPYVALCLMLMCLGEALGVRSKFPRIKNNLIIKLGTLGYISVIGSLMLIYDLLRLNTVKFGMRISDHQISTIGVLGNVLASFGIIVWLYGLYGYVIEKKRIRLISYLSLVSYVAGGVVSAGRQAILIIILSSVILVLWGLKSKRDTHKSVTFANIKKSQPWGFYIVIGVFFAYFVSISNNRSRISDIDLRIKSYETVFNAKTSEHALLTGEKLGPFQDIYMEFIYYYSQELIRLDLLFQDYHFPPLMGLSQLSYVERRIDWLIGTPSEKSWNEIVNVLEKKNKFNSHTWGTFITNFIIDFGRLGAPVVCLILGWIFGILFKEFKREANSFSVIRLSILCAGIVFSIQFSPVSELTWTVPAIMSSFIIVSNDRIRFSLKSKSSVSVADNE